MSPEIIFDPFSHLYSEAAGLIKSSEIRDLMSVTGRSDIISFAGGLPFIGGLPAEDIEGVMSEVLSGGYEQALQYGETEGMEPLKEQLVELMAAEGVKAEAEHLQVTTGSQQALDLLGRIFIDPDDVIIMEGPTYVGALTAFRPNGPTIISVPLDDEGMRVDVLASELERMGEARPKFIYTVPSFQNPAGVTMNESRREELLRLAREYDVLIIEDNPYGLLRFEGEHVRPLAARDPSRVIYLETLSKIISPGIRLGWVFAPSPITERVAVLKQCADLCSSNLSQMFAQVYLARGLWRKNLEVLKVIYRSRRDAMKQALAEHFPEGSSWTDPQGGLFLWVTLPEYLNTEKMLPMAIESKVAFVPGPAFYADRSGTNRMRLNFSYSSEDLIEEGIARLGKVLEKEMRLYHSLGLDCPGEQ
jgi:2-aminoadipate transaminase